MDEGLRIIINAIRIARTIFQRMRNYLQFRIAESVQLLGFFFIAVVFINPSKFLSEEAIERDSVGNVFMLPTMCVVLITVFNDISMITLAYDRTIPSTHPSAWEVTQLSSLATLMGVVSAVNNLLILVLFLDASNANSWFAQNINNGEMVTYGQTLAGMYLAKSIAGFLTVFTCRTGSRSWWARMPCWQLSLVFAIIMVVTTVLSVAWPGFLNHQHGDLAIRSLNWRLCLFVWGWCLVWFLN